MAYPGSRYGRSYDPYYGTRSISQRLPWIDTAPPVSYRRDNKKPRPMLDRVNFSWLDGPGKSGPSDNDVRNLRSTTASPKTRSLDLKLEEAFALVDQALKGHRRTIIACSKDWKPKKPKDRTLIRTIPFQVFHELDKEFFRSMLSGNVSLGWSKLPDGVFSRTIRAGQNSNPRIRIELSSQLSWHRAPQHILAALVHQMVHAYYLQCCGYSDPNADGGHDLCHERPFWSLLQCIGEHLEPLRDVLNKDLEVVSNKDHNKSRICSCRSSSKVPRLGGSRCYEAKKHCSDEDIHHWRDFATATAKSLQEARDGKSSDFGKQNKKSPLFGYYLDKDGREQSKALDLSQNPGEAFVFLQHEDRSFPVARSTVADLAALTASPYFKDKYYLSFPPDTTTGDFQFFHLFLVHGVYPPSIRGSDQHQFFRDREAQRPPKIQPFDANAPAKIRSLLVAYRLSLRLQYKPFSEHVRRGLWSLSASAEDPVALLDLIYCNHDFWNEKTAIKSPEPKLREWVRAWLTVNLSSTDTASSYGPSYPTNLAVLRRHPQWQDRYNYLKAQSSDLRDDDREAETQLRARYATSSSSVVSQDRARRLTPTEEEQEYAVRRGIQSWIQQQQPPIHRSPESHHYHPPVLHPWQPYVPQEASVAMQQHPPFPGMSSFHASLPVPYAEDPHGIVNPEVLDAYFSSFPGWQQQVRSSNPGLVHGFTPEEVEEMLASFGYAGF